MDKNTKYSEYTGKFETDGIGKYVQGRFLAIQTRADGGDPDYGISFTYAGEEAVPPPEVPWQNPGTWKGPPRTSGADSEAGK